MHGMGKVVKETFEDIVDIVSVGLEYIEYITSLIKTS